MRVDVITGACGGMGLACARALPQDDRLLLLTDVDAGRLDEAAQSLAAEGRKVDVVVGDLREATTRSRLVEALTRSGELGAALHTAGVSPMMASGEDVLDVDLVASAHLLDDLTPQLRAGSVAVCFASIAGHMAPVPPELEALLDDPGRDGFVAEIVGAAGGDLHSGYAYVLAKRGLIRLCERLARPWGLRGARIVSLSPGLIDTAMGRLELDDNPGKQPLLDATPLQRPGEALPGTPEQIADVAAFLCSERAAFVTGCDLRVDGGLVGALRHP